MPRPAPSQPLRTPGNHWPDFSGPTQCAPLIGFSPHHCSGETHPGHCMRASVCSFLFLSSAAPDQHFTLCLSVLPRWTPLLFPVCSIMHSVAMNILACVFCLIYTLSQMPQIFVEYYVSCTELNSFTDGILLNACHNLIRLGLLSVF